MVRNMHCHIFYWSVEITLKHFLPKAIKKLPEEADMLLFQLGSSYLSICDNPKRFCSIVTFFFFVHYVGFDFINKDYLWFVLSAWSFALMRPFSCILTYVRYILVTTSLKFSSMRRWLFLNLFLIKLIITMNAIGLFPQNVHKQIPSSLISNERYSLP